MPAIKLLDCRRGLSNGHDLAVVLGLRLDGPKPFRVARPNQLPVMSENHPAVRVPHFERERSGVLEIAPDGSWQRNAAERYSAKRASQPSRAPSETVLTKFAGVTGPECFRTGTSQARRFG